MEGTQRPSDRRGRGPGVRPTPTPRGGTPTPRGALTPRGDSYPSGGGVRDPPPLPDPSTTFLSIFRRDLDLEQRRGVLLAAQNQLRADGHPFGGM